MNLDQLGIQTLRMLAVDMVEAAQSGHPGMPMGAAPMAYVLWTRFLRHNPRNPQWPDRDRFVLSAGHGSALLYGLLHLLGYDLSLEELRRFRQWGSRTPGHPEYGHTPGVECTTGPLGQGFAMGVGLAMAERFLAARFNRPGFEIVNHFTYGIVSDGDLMEGVSAEAASLAGHLRLGRLIYLYDQNSITLAGDVRLTFSEDVKKRLIACGWHVEAVPEGNDIEAIAGAIRAAREESQRPSLIAVRTHIGYGSPHKQDTFEAHGSPLGEMEVEATKKNLGWPLEPKFYVPNEAREILTKSLERGERFEREWRDLLEGYRRKYPELYRQWQQEMNGILSEDWEAAIPSFSPDPKGLATRSAGGKVLNALAKKIPFLMGGSADLNPSTQTALAGKGNFQAPPGPPEKVQGAESGIWDYGGANVHFGVREHAMGGILNGLALHGGILPYGSTFLVFSDYLRPAIRLAALMKLRVIYVFTHDSIAVGEDGPTHQPVEHLMALRAIPGLTVIRPADANETAEAWRWALKQREGPVALILTRQALPVIDRKNYAPAAGLARGAYILADSPGGAPSAILIATGSEVHLALEAYESARRKGVPLRVISMPSWEIFERQEKEYRDRIFPWSFRRRISIEAGATQGWWKYVGSEGEVIGIDHFGASAPGKVLLEKFEFTAQALCQKIEALCREEKG
jgi:transketolase